MWKECDVFQNEIPGNIPDGAWNAMLSAADKNNDGRIDLDEYKAIIQGTLNSGGGGNNSQEVLNISQIWIRRN